MKFDHQEIDINVLKQRAYNFRWAEVDDGIIPLTAADPDFKCAPAIRQALTDYIDGGYFSYTPKEGFPQFKEAMHKYLKEMKNEEVPVEGILPIDSAARGMWVIAEAVLQPGDEAIVFDPCDFLFRKSVEHAKGKVVLFPADVVDGKIDLSHIEDYITPKTKMICLCNPHNPLGKLYPKEDLIYLLDLCAKHDLYIMNDEIWSDITYPEKPFLSIMSVKPELNHRILSVFGFSKSFGIAGLRVGCVYSTNAELFEKCVVASCVRETAGGISSLSQVAGIACLNDSRQWLAEFKAHLCEMRDYLCERVNAMEGLSVTAPEGTYLAYVDISSLNMSGAEFTAFLQENVKLALVPGGETFFGVRSEGHVRICFATSKQILKEGLDRLEEGLKLLKNK